MMLLFESVMSNEISIETERWYLQSLEEGRLTSALVILRHAIECRDSEELGEKLCDIGERHKECGKLSSAERHLVLALSVYEHFCPNAHHIALRAARLRIEVLQEEDNTDHLKEALDDAFTLVWRLKKFIRLGKVQ